MIGILWGRRMMKQAELNGSLGVEQHGSVKGKDSIGLVIQKQANFSMARLSWTNMASFDNDANKATDRMASNRH
jgi:hypothetical protein